MIYHRDKAISNRNEDKLNRNAFAEQLADDVFSAATSKDESVSIVFGLIGEWGSGKSSILKLISGVIEKKIADQNDDYIPNSSRSVFFSLRARPDLNVKKVRVEQIWFDSWLASSHSQLVSQYLSLVESKLSRYDFRFSSLLRKYSDLINSALDNSSKLGIVSKVFRFFNPHDLRKTKSEINRKLVENDVHLIVFVDDTDRLIGNRVAEFVQFISAVVDFENTVFVIAYNERYVIDALRSSGMDKQFADEFLSKVIQVPITVPMIGSINKDSLFQFHVIDWLRDRRIIIKIRSDVQGALLEYYIRTIRDMKLFANALLARRDMFSNGLEPVYIVIVAAFELFMPDVAKGLFSSYNSFMDYLNSFLKDGEKIAKDFGEQNANKMDKLLRYINVSSGTEKKPITNEEFYYWYFSDFEQFIDNIHRLLSLCGQVTNGTNEAENKNAIHAFFEKLQPVTVFSFRRDFNKYFSEIAGDRKRKEAEHCLRTILRYYDEFDYTGDGIFEQNAVIQVQLDYIIRCFYVIFSEITDKEEISSLLYQFLVDATKEAVLYIVIWFLLNNTTIKNVYAEFHFPDVFWNLLAQSCGSVICQWRVFEVEQIWFSTFLLQFAKKSVDWGGISLADFSTKERADDRAKEPITALFEILDSNKEEYVSGDLHRIANAYRLFVPVDKSETTKYYVRSDQFNSYALLVGSVDLYKRGREIRELITGCLNMKAHSDDLTSDDYQLLALDEFLYADSSKREMIKTMGVSKIELNKYYNKLKLSLKGIALDNPKGKRGNEDEKN